MTLGKVGQRFEDVTGKVTFAGTTLHLSKTVVHDRDGQLELSGDLALESLERMRGEFEANAKRFPIRREGVVLGSIDGQLHLVAQIDPQRTTLDLALRKAAIELNQEDFGPVQTLKPNREVHFTDVRAGDPAPESEDNSETVLRIDASDPFWVRREDFGVLIGTHMTIVSRGDQPEITGTLEIQRGTIELIGQIFDIDRGRIEFSGGHDVEPTLDLVAKRNMPSGSTVSVQAQGPLHEPTLTFTIDDKAVPPEEALAALSGGGGAGSASMQSQLSSVATGMAAGVLTLGARRQLGDWVPVLAVESGANETRVRAGVEARRLIPKFLRKLVVDAYVEGMVSSVQDANETDSETQSSAQTQAAVLLELRFPHSLVGEAQYGPGQRWSTDLSWEP
jgi:translocation and assembly module TamB